MRVRRRRAALVLVLALAVALELGARVLEARAWRPAPPFGQGAERDAWLARALRDQAEGKEPPGYSTFDAELGWAPRPGYASADGSVHVNAAGQRGARTYAPRAPAGVRRVLAFGESFTFGEEVADEEAWCARLEAQGADLEVLNYGVGGYGTDQALLRLEREVHAPADVLVVGLMLENIGRNVNRYRPLWYPSSQPAAKPRFVLGAHGLERVPQPFATRVDFIEAVRTGTVLATLAPDEHWDDGAPPGLLGASAVARLIAGRRAYAARALERLWQDPAGEPYRVTLALLEAFRARATELGIARTLVLVFPRQPDVELLAGGGKPYWSGLLSDLAQRGIEVLDLTPPLAEAARAGAAPLYLESHFSPRANDLVARAIFTRLAHDPATGAPK